MTLIVHFALFIPICRENLPSKANKLSSSKCFHHSWIWDWHLYWTTWHRSVRKWMRHICSNYKSLRNEVNHHSHCTMRYIRLLSEMKMSEAIPMPYNYHHTRGSRGKRVLTLLPWGSGGCAETRPRLINIAISRHRISAYYTPKDTRVHLSVILWSRRCNCIRKHVCS